MRSPYKGSASCIALKANLRQAEESLKQALTIYEQALGKNHPKLVEPLKLYSAVVRQNGREEEAKTLEARIETIQTRFAKRNNDRIVR